MASDAMTGWFHNPFKSWSPFNQAFFAGAGICHSYNEHGHPYTLKRQLCLGSTFTSKLLWTPDYHLKGRSNLSQSIEKGSRNNCGCKLEELRHHPIMFVQRDQGAKYVVIHMHGNGMDVGDTQEIAVQQAARWQSHVLIPEYPGYGEAPGHASVKDVEWAVMSATWFAITELKVPHDRLIIHGYSIGSGAACMLARSLCEMDMPPACLMLHAGYTSIRALAAVLVGPVGYTTFNRFKTKRNLPYVTAPVLILHGDQDELIPFYMGVENYKSREQSIYPTEFFRQPGCTHNEYNVDMHVVTPGLQFLQRHVKGYTTANILALGNYPKEYDKPPEDIDQIHKLQKKSKRKMAAHASCMCGAVIIEFICGSVWLGWRAVKRNCVTPVCPSLVKSYKIHIRGEKDPHLRTK